MDKVKKIRAVNEPGSVVGKQRHDLYQQAHDQIKNATQQGFYLEAITIIESLISDRLESRLVQLHVPDMSFKTLGVLIRNIRKVEIDEELRELVVQQLDQWRIDRNHVVHEMVKVEEGDTSNWNERITRLPGITTDGLTLLKKISNRVKCLRNKEKRKNKLIS